MIQYTQRERANQYDFVFAIVVANRQGFTQYVLIENSFAKSHARRFLLLFYFRINIYYLYATKNYARTSIKRHID